MDQRTHFETAIRKIGPGLPATMGGISHPLRAMQILKPAPTSPACAKTTMVDTRA
ncbi:MAG: hypothetical protein H7338_13650 [Candidatus Sericytochromatia bacterium]|nr:hypothetical protein [Candidatus Sericytochromatia bacterium]